MSISVGEFHTYKDDQDEVFHTLGEPTFDLSLQTWDNFKQVYTYHEDIEHYQAISYTGYDIREMLQ